jgi:hypothetical protein
MTKQLQRPRSPSAKKKLSQIISLRDLDLCRQELHASALSLHVELACFKAMAAGVVAHV